MQTNPAIQNSGRIAWNGAAARAIDIRKHVNFGFSFEATADIAADTTFIVQAADPDATDRCIPGAFANVPAVGICEAVPAGTLSTFVIPAGTKAGAVCSGAIPCRSGAFIRLSAGTGQTGDVLAVAILSGPIL